jgi:hypothetical protein
MATEKQINNPAILNEVRLAKKDLGMARAFKHF